ncbi:MAG: LacI family DNA-binding transcriptional regulator, partial [Spirochaetia bacterium]|nr:LacI family DNA-binding transcriptional regulator [Spirochaetia bacterium]
FLRAGLECRTDFIDFPASKDAGLLDENQCADVAAFLVGRESQTLIESRVLRPGRVLHSPQKKKATLADIGRQCGVTANTASRALHRKPGVEKEMSRRIFRKAHSLGYKKIPPLREATILIFRQIPSPQTGPFRIEPWRLAELAAEQGVALNVYEAISRPISVDPDLPVLRESIKRIEPDAILAFSFTREFLAKTQKVAEPLGLPVISFQVSGTQSGLDSVFIDNGIGIEKHLRFCLENGIRDRIGYVSTWRPEAFAEQERFAFFKKSIDALGIERQTSWEILVPLEWDLRWPRPVNHPAIYYDPHYFQKQIKARISENVAGGISLPRVFLCYNDLAASLLHKSFLELGIPPPRIHGWDADAELLGAITADVPTIDIPSDEMTRSFVALLLRRLLSPAAPELSLSLSGRFLSSIREKDRQG